MLDQETDKEDVEKTVTKGARAYAYSVALIGALLAGLLAGCDAPAPATIEDATSDLRTSELTQRPQVAPPAPAPEEAAPPQEEPAPEPEATPAPSGQVDFADLNITQDLRSVLYHGDKSAQYQKYIVLHDTEGGGSPANVVSGWANSSTYTGAHFVVGKDGTVVQALPLDQIAHHAGYGNNGHNSAYGVEDESRDDRRGTTYFSDSYQDYGMNSYSVGIEIVHSGGEGDYPTAQLEALDKLIAYIDAYYGFPSSIIAHNDWATSNSDTSPEFSGYLANYKSTRSYKG